MARYINNILIRQTEEGKRYFTSAIPSKPIVGQIEYTYTARVGDRWDSLAFRFLGSATYWYALAAVNGGANGSIFIKPGTVITIPESV